MKSDYSLIRKYKSGTNWCIWRWTEVDSEYIKRLHVVKTPWFAICLHWILKPDPEPYLHDHPVTFLSLILRGGYTEIRANKEWVETFAFDGLVRTHKWFNFIRASDGDMHTIIHVKPKTLTLCFMGPKRREWGFYRGDSKPWIFWKDYYAAKRRGEQP